MKKIIAFNGSPRPKGNTTYMLKHFLDGAISKQAKINKINAYEVNVNSCMGCLRCNLIKKCAKAIDDWENISSKILDSDIIVFSSPIYFHHLTSPLKAILDRFRSFMKVRITETGLKHTAWQKWNKDFVLLLGMGSSNDEDAKPVIELFEYLIKMLGGNNNLHIVKRTRLAVSNQINMDINDLEILYSKLGLPIRLAKNDALENSKLLKNCFELGKNLSTL